MATTSATFLMPQPPVNQPVAERGTNVLTTVWRNYLQRLDLMFRQAQIGPLANAANDGAAATAGVPINGLYRNGNAVQIRLT